MNHLALVLEKVVTDKIISAATGPAARSNKIGQDLLGLSALFALIASGFFIFAAFLWLQEHYSPQIAAAIAGGIAIGISCLMMLFAFAIAQYKRSMIKKIKSEVRHSVQDLISVVDDLIGEPVSQNPAAAALLATMVGFITGQKIL